MRHKRFFLLNPTTSVQGNLTRFKTGAIKTSLKSIIVLATFALYLVPSFGQSPEKMSYQAVIRNSSDVLVINTQVGMQISILQGTSDGSPVYVETLTPTTNANGLVIIEIGAGTVLNGDFTAINWANGPYFIKTETDPAGGTSYTITGTSQLLSVPYALHAKTAETITESDPLFTSWDKTTGVSITESQISDLGTYIETETDPVYSSSEAANITASDITNLGNLSGTNTGDQDLSALASKIALGDSTAFVRSEIPDVSGYLSSESDPVFAAWDKTTGISITESQISDFGTYIETETQNLDDVLTQSNSAGNNNITNLANPVNNQDAATKAYVDALLERIEALEESDLLNNGFIDTRDDIHYSTVKIGNQIWMAENLKTTKYNDGTAIPNVTDNTEWEGLSTGAYCWHDNDQETNGDTYGALYNWYVVETGSLCPSGWHLPTDAEWKTLEMYLGMSQAEADASGWRGTDEGGKLKENGTTYWISPNTGATNESGFSALPGDYRNADGSFGITGGTGLFWSSSSNALYRALSYNLSSIYRYTSQKERGFSVRCLRDD